jgi:hypothetical protein
MLLRTTAVLVTLSMLALGSPDALAAKKGAGKPAARRGARTTETARRPRRVDGEAPGAPSLARTRAPRVERSVPAASVRGRAAAPVRQRRVARDTTYATPYHAARAAQQRRPGRIKRWLIAAGVVAAIGVGFVAGNAFGLGKTVDNFFDRTTQQQQVWDNVPPPPDWAPGFGERPAWAPDPPDPGSFPQLGPNGSTSTHGPMTPEEAQKKLAEIMGNGSEQPKK